ncbi:MAG: site-specific DNA-methyltransferase, partial [Desulfobacteraceae bacterium]|nr:site-specific DNA-methyltransferase [Desulfobacteraceae bacterium]
HGGFSHFNPESTGFRVKIKKSLSDFLIFPGMTHSENWDNAFFPSPSNENDLVIDPFSGSGTTLVVAEQLGRQWLGCDLSHEYNEWAIKRLENVAYRRKEEWIAIDRANDVRRNSIR